jgi:hypothetical protein
MANPPQLTTSFGHLQIDSSQVAWLDFSARAAKSGRLVVVVFVSAGNPCAVLRLSGAACAYLKGERIAMR